MHKALFHLVSVDIAILYYTTQKNRSKCKMNEARLQEFVHQVVGDMAASMSGVMANIGHKLGLYKAMAGAGAKSSKNCKANVSDWR
jgi:hypothetical protein